MQKRESWKIRGCLEIGEKHDIQKTGTFEKVAETFGVIDRTFVVVVHSFAVIGLIFVVIGHTFAVIGCTSVVVWLRAFLVIT